MREYTNILRIKEIFFFLGFIVLGFYLAPLFVYGSGINVTQYDNLDSNVVWFKILAESGKIFAPSSEIIPNMMGGLPRLSYGSEFNLLLWMYVFFEPFTAYVINEVLMHVVAFLGMFLLTERHIVISEYKYRYLYVFIPSILFAMLPFWTHGALSVAGQPLVLWAFLNIRKNVAGKIEWLVIFLVPFYSSFVLTYFFFLIMLGGLFLYDLIIKKTANRRFFLAIMIMGVIFLIVEYRLVYGMFFETDFISHRTAFSFHIQTYADSFKHAHLMFLNGHDHSKNLQYKYILPIILLGMFLSFFRSKFNQFFSFVVVSLFLLFYYFDIWKILLAQTFSLPALLAVSLAIYVFSKDKRLLSGLMILQIVIAYFSAFWYHSWLLELGDYINFVKTFNFGRFYLLQALIWFIMLGVAVNITIHKLYFSSIVLGALLIVQCWHSFQYRSFTTKVASSVKSFDAYYATELFARVKQRIGKPVESYRVVSFGIEPAITLYNGLWTVDGYSVNYPLRYKYEFRKIIEHHLDSMPVRYGNDRFVYDKWGSKLYLMNRSATLLYRRGAIVDDLDIDIEQLYLMGGRYIVSGYKLSQPEKYGLDCLGEFGDVKSYWNIYLYEIKRPFIKETVG